MANGGWYGTEEEWERIEAPFISLDTKLENFAALHCLQITRNHKSWPSRSMEWGEELRCFINLYLDDEETLGINLWICVSEDRGLKRYWRHEFLCNGTSLDEIAPRLHELLTIAKARLDEWQLQPERMVFATKLAKI
ncbi:MAG: hypothetical protein WDZ84_01575 [Rhodovibrionaceae bacterium]